MAGSSSRSPVELAQLAHPIAHGLRVHEQRGGGLVAPALVQQPRAQGAGQLVGGGRLEVGQGSQGLGTQVGQGLGVGPQHEGGQVLLGVERGLARAQRERTQGAE